MYQSFAKVRRKLQTAKRFSVFFNGMNRNILSCDKLKTKNRFSRDREHEEQVLPLQIKHKRSAHPNG